MNDTLPSIFLQPGRDRRAARGHPWVYSNEIAMTAEAKAIAPGSVAVLRRTDGKALGLVLFNPHTLIAARLLDAEPGATIGAGWLAVRLRAALALRDRLFATPYYRLVHAEADGLPGLVVDRFGDVLVCQFNCAGMDRLREPLLEALGAVLSPRAVVLRNDSRQRALEGLESRVEIAVGGLDGPIEVPEAGVRFLADPAAGQKTGWFFDQRDHRALVAGLARGARVLDVYCHTGGFGLACAAAGAASVHLVDSSAPALDLARRTAEANGMAERCAFDHDDAFAAMERLAAAGERFEVVIADPPAFARSRKDVGPALRAYRKVARLAASLVAPGGFLFCASCSHTVGPAEFAAEVAQGLLAAGRGGRILKAGGAAPDHPVHPLLPETAYLKGLLLNLD